MTTKRNLLSVIRRVSVVALTMLIATGSLSLSTARQTCALTKIAPAILQSEAVPEEHHVTVAGLAQGQTARLSITNSPNPRSSEPALPILVEMMFHDSNDNVIVDRTGHPAQRTVVINPHHSESLELNGNNIAAPGSRVGYEPCFRVLSIGGGSVAVPTFEIYNNLLRTTSVLTAGTLRGFDSQPDPPVPPEVSFGTMALTRGVSARLYVLNEAMEEGSTTPAEPITVEITFHDNNGNPFLDRNGREVSKTVTVEPCYFVFLELNGNDIAAPGARVVIVPCLKVLSGGRGSRVAMTLETYLNLNQQTLTLANWQSPSEPETPAPR